MSKFLKKMFKKKEKNVDKQVYHIVQYQNNHIKLVSDACSICYNPSKVERTDEERAEYIRRRIKEGHESILEHSNIIIDYIISDDLLLDLNEVLQECKYLEACVSLDKDIKFTLAGSIRGFKHIIREIKNLNNRVVSEIISSLYEIHSCYFEDFIRDNIMSRYKFMDIIYRSDLKPIGDKPGPYIVSNDSIKDLERHLNLDFESVIKLATVTFNIKDVSRIISQQLTRHRVAITQLSQRYVNASQEKFNSPLQFKPEKYDQEKLYHIEIFGKEVMMTAQQLGDELLKIYPQLIEQDMLKEDARSYLPNNTTTSLYMTFTYKKLLKFLELRTNKAAQAEVRLIANAMYEMIKDIDSRLVDFKYLSPSYKRIEDKLTEEVCVDEIIQETEEIL